MDRGDLAAARERYEKARGLFEQVAPAGLEMAIVLDRLIEVAQREGKAAEPTERLAADALAIIERIAPNSASHAFALRRVGRLARDRGDLARAAAAYSQSLDAVEAQSHRLGGSNEVRTAFAGQRRAIYLEYVDILMRLGQPAAAFDVLERSRARALLMMLAERDLVLDGDLSAELKQTTRDLRAQDDRLQESFAKLNPERTPRKSSGFAPGSASFAASGIRSSTAFARRPPGSQPCSIRNHSTCGRCNRPSIVAPSCCPIRSAPRPPVCSSCAAPADAGGQSLMVHTLPIGEAGLRAQVTSFRRLIERDAASANGAAPAFTAAARQLYDLLIAPAAPGIAASERVLIVPDGPLHTLPFAALVRPAKGSGGRPWQYFVEWKPLHTALSATFYAELRKGPVVSSGAPTLVAFGDPQYPGGPEGTGSARPSDVQAMLRRGYVLTPLPSTRAEVAAIARGFGERATVYLGAEATEARAKSIATTRYLHFATHGLLDARSPLDSALALTVPAERRQGEENGLLQAWEIFEQLRINADLVTLSACETALGDDVAGEGLIGLTRAFHYAGARTVLATLWRVADESTSTLMNRFYTHLRAGASKDGALRRAQLEAIARPASAVPFHWAAFTLSGDWR